ncbi:hypothetical protein [Flavobacterium sp.]|jgi:hypothetical protein|uniref:hypothetical protein n=1 Tax=Flavobacterium sp. TaxID=239 RepID=UPI0037BF765F
MKKLLLLSALFISFLTFAQVPQGISYQAIALNTSGNPVVNSNVRIRLSILNNSVTGTNLYSETHLRTTNAQGLFNLVIGQGTVVSGTFNTINWSTNSKFLSVEMDIAGGTNFVAVGTTQLLSVPYALAADSLITSPGEGITLVSPNGTPYQVTVNDSGQLSLPSTNSSSTSSPNNFYMYGSFNSFNPTSALLMDNSFGLFANSIIRTGYRYLTAGTEIKFLASNSVSSPIYGINITNNLTINGSSFLVNNTGFYLINLINLNEQNNYPLESFSLGLSSFAPTLILGSGNNINGTYSVANNRFTFIVNGISNSSGSNTNFRFNILGPEQTFDYGDNLSDGTIDNGGTSITFPNLTSTPKNFRVELTLNFNGSGTYTITQI